VTSRSTAGGPVIGVIGGSGGVGASSFAAVLAVCAGRSFLVDLDPAGGGIDVTLGIEGKSGARWSGLQLAGGQLDPATLASGLPGAGQCSVLAADTADLDAAAVDQVLDVAAASGTVIVDLPRTATAARAAAMLRTELIVVVARADVAGLVAAHAVVSALPELSLGVVMRHGPVAPAQAAELIGVALLGQLPALRVGGALIDARRPPRAAAKLACGILAGFSDRAAAS
jgi:secretion/DNA translocation related CpaE-like protein